MSEGRIRVLTPEEGDARYAPIGDTGGGGVGLVPQTRTVNGHALDSNVVVTPADIGLGNVDNTSDVNKPISTAAQTALNAKVPTTRTVAGHPLSADVTFTKSDVALANVDNTSDVNKPISSAQAAVNAAKADLVGGFVPASQIPAIAVTEFLGTVASQSAMLALVGQKGDWCIRSDTGASWIITGTDPTQLSNWTAISTPTTGVTSVAGRSGAVTLAKSDVALANVDNTSDVNKPVSTATTTALSNKVDNTRTVNGHALTADVTVTKTDVGLGSVDNTADTAKPVSTAQAAADAAVLAAAVQLTGAQTVAGVKTFSASPILPTPTPGDSSTVAATTAFATIADAIIAATVTALGIRVAALEGKVGGTQFLKATSATTFGAWDGTGWTGSVSTSSAIIRIYMSADTVMTTLPTYYNANDLWFPSPSQA